MFGPVIEGERVRLEPPRPEHSPAYLGWLADMEVTRYLHDRNPPSPGQEEKSLEQAAGDPHRVLWSIVLRQSGKLIGAAVLEKIDWRKRYAAEVMRLRTEYAFLELGLRKVWAGVEVANVASRRALEKTGYRQCGLMRRHVFVGGQWLDVWLGEILREDWD